MEKFFKRPWLIVAVIGIITIFFALQLPRAELDNNNIRFVPDNDPAMVKFRQIDETFGSSIFILVGLDRKYGSVFEKDFLGLIRDYVKRVEEIGIVKNVNSLVTTDYITSGEDSVEVVKLVGDDFSGTPGEINELKRRVLSWNLYEKALVSEDFSATQILIPLDIGAKDAGRPEAIASFTVIRDLAYEMFAGKAEVYVTGMPVISATINEEVVRDLIFLVPLVVALLLLSLFFSFRRFSAVALPLLTVIVATVWAVGAMPLLGVRLSVLTTVLPVILVAVGSAYGIHVVTHYIAEAGTSEMSAEEHRELIFRLLRRIIKPVFLAALTTFVGFVSFIFTEVIPIREFGIFSSLGTLVSFGVAVTLIPALLIIRGPKSLVSRKRERLQSEDARGAFDPLSDLIADVFTSIARKKRFTIFLTIIVTLVSLYGLSKVIIDNILVEYFKSDTVIFKSDKFIREKFGGSKVVNVVAEADTPEELLHPSSLLALDGLSTYLNEQVPQVGKAMGFTDLVKRINQVFNADESPEGLGASYASAEDSLFLDSFGFSQEPSDESWEGFGFWPDDSGVDGSGFGSFEDDASPSSVSPDAPEEAASGRPGGDKVYTQDELLTLLNKAGGISWTMNVKDFLWELKKQVNYEGASYYEIPGDPAKYRMDTEEDLQALVSNYLVLLSGNLDQYANDPLEPTAVRTTVQLSTLGERDSAVALQAIDDYVKANFPDNIRVTVGGVSLVEFSLNRLVVNSQLVSVIISIVMVFIIVALSNQSITAGFIGIAPLSISILINFAIMGFGGIKLNIGTALVASVSVGIGIDYTIHFIESYKREYRALRGKGDYLRRTFATSGKAIIINAISVGLGFAALILSRFNILASLGLLIAFTMATSSLISLTVIPGLLSILEPKFIRKLADNG